MTTWTGLRILLMLEWTNFSQSDVAELEAYAAGGRSCETDGELSDFAHDVMTRRAANARR